MIQIIYKNGKPVIYQAAGGNITPSAPVNISAPFLQGTGEVNTNLTCKRGVWSGFPAISYEYDFLVDGNSAQFGTQNTYLVKTADIGKTITCIVTATNTEGSANATTSNSKKGGTAPVNTVLPTIDVTGNQLIGTVLTATDGTWTGSTPITYQYRWTRNGVPISGETTNTYTLQPADETATIRVQVRGINDYNTSAYVTSDDSVVGGYAPVNTGLPVMNLSGNQLVGQTIGFTTEGTWTGTPTVTLQYRWLRNGSPIGGAINNTYTLVAADDGATITAQVRGTNAWGTSAYSTSSNSINAGTVPVNTFAPNVSGSTSLGDTLTTTDGTWSGTPTITYTYQWKRNGVDIVGETANTYVIGSSDSLANITCEVKATNSFGFNTQISNTVTVDNFAPVNTVAPTVSPNGTQSTGTVITVNVGTWSGVPTITYAYRWTRNGTPISGATASTYTIQVADDGTTIRCEVRGTNAYGVSSYIASSNSVSAVNAIAPVNTVAPVISGSTTLGSTLTSTTGTWTGIPTPTYAYQWKRNGSNIGGAINSTYVTTLADSSANITCDVTATNTAGSATAGSNTITLPSYAPVNTVLPVVSGTAVVGQTLSTTNGTWANSPSTFAYQWFRGATPIGTNSPSYTLVQADAGQNIKCTVTATNTAGSASADSNVVAILATLLDLYPNAAAAYSVRLLRGAYLSSPSIRVRRSNDNAEQDIGFTTAGDLNTSALTTFVGSNSAFIVTWFDQSGNANNATQTTPANQPRIVNAGVLDVVNGKTSFRFDGSNDTLKLTNVVTPASGVYTAYGVGKRLASSNSFTIFGNNIVGTATLLLSQLDTNRYYFQRNTGYLESAIDTTANQIMLLGLASSTNLLKRNGALLSNSLIVTSIGNNIRTIGQYNASLPARLNGDLQEAVIWNSDQTSNVTGIESNTNTYYAIY